MVEGSRLVLAAALLTLAARRIEGRFASSERGLDARDAPILAFPRKGRRDLLTAIRT